MRVPGVESDKIVHYKDSNHIVVIHKGCYYKMLIYHKGRLLKPRELQLQFELILSSKSQPIGGEKLFASLTGVSFLIFFCFKDNIINYLKLIY